MLSNLLSANQCQNRCGNIDNYVRSLAQGDEKKRVEILVVEACAVVGSHRTAAFANFHPCEVEVAFEVPDCLVRGRMANLAAGNEQARSSQVVAGWRVDDRLVRVTDHQIAGVGSHGRDRLA